MSCSQPCRHKYSQLSATHIFTPVAIETAGTWHHLAVELVQELGRQATIITGDSRETTYLFQQLSVALQKGNAVSFQNMFTARQSVSTGYLLFSLQYLVPAVLCSRAIKIITYSVIVQRFKSVVIHDSFVAVNEEPGI